MSAEHKSGFVNIVGNPNVGKSTLSNVLLGERLSIISHKPQTTRHRILGIYNEPDYQIVFSDTPGIIDDPRYKMQKAMNHFAMTVLEDADVVLFMTDTLEDSYTGDEHIVTALKKVTVPVFLIINKIDVNAKKADEIEKKWAEIIEFTKVFKISALEKLGTDELFEEIKNNIPVFPPYFPKDQLTDKSERFFMSEIIREKILLLYQQEIPYSVQIVTTEFREVEKNGAPFVYIKADIYAMRKTQKIILIGKGGSSIKQLGIDSRKSIEAFLGKRVHLELYVRIKEKWRDDERHLKSFGYIQ
jgi:GTP-binding protein Era